MISIYGLFDAAGICLYIGRTVNIKARETSHRNLGRKFHSLKVLKRVTKRANTAEGKFIRKYKALGQAALNQNTNHCACFMTTKEMISLILAMPVTGEFTVPTLADRSRVSSIAKTLRQAGRIEFQVTSRKSEAGFVFFIVPTNL